jgi:hypothetical protein
VITGMDFFTVEILTWLGLVTYCVSFVIQLETRRAVLASPTSGFFASAARPLAEALHRGRMIL